MILYATFITDQTSSLSSQVADWAIGSQEFPLPVGSWEGMVKQSSREEMPLKGKDVTLW